jgi:hypothetical protein
MSIPEVIFDRRLRQLCEEMGQRGDKYRKGKQDFEKLVNPTKDLVINL